MDISRYNRMIGMSGIEEITEEAGKRIKSLDLNGSANVAMLSKSSVLVFCKNHFYELSYPDLVPGPKVQAGNTNFDFTAANLKFLAGAKDKSVTIFSIKTGFKIGEINLPEGIKTTYQSGGGWFGYHRYMHFRGSNLLFISMIGGRIGMVRISDATQDASEKDDVQLLNVFNPNSTKKAEDFHFDLKYLFTVSADGHVSSIRYHDSIGKTEETECQVKTVPPPNALISYNKEIEISFTAIRAHEEFLITACMYASGKDMRLGFACYKARSLGLASHYLTQSCGNSTLAVQDMSIFNWKQVDWIAVLSIFRFVSLLAVRKYKIYPVKIFFDLHSSANNKIVGMADGGILLTSSSGRNLRILRINLSR